MSLPGSIRLKSLTKIGEGIQGKVYLIDAERCVKIYKKTKYFHRELECLKMGAGEAFFPKIIEVGDEFIIREYIPGLELNKHLKNHPLTATIAQQLLDLFHCLERLHFRRLDVRLDHIILTPEGNLRLIDPANLMHMREDYPKRMLKGLDEVGCRDEFLAYVDVREPKLAMLWRYRAKISNIQQEQAFSHR
ncbi:MAG TPA: hypothetical protein VHR47_13985 [Bacillota bacterium]|nr:hypothetical protein [Bacillota bacterium]